MKQKLLTFKSGLLTKLLLSFTLLLAGVGNIWADTTIFGGTVASGWEYKNSLDANASVSANGELTDFGGYGTPKTYTSTGTFSISSGETIKITAKRYSDSSSNLPSIKVRCSSDGGSSWTEIKEFTSSDITSKANFDDVIVDDSRLIGSYKIQFEIKNVYISSIVLQAASTVPSLSITHPDSGDDFGYVTENTTKTYTIENTGAGSMDVNILSSDPAFTVSTSSLTGITNDGVGKTFSVTFNYDSSAPQPHSATITVTPDFDGAVAQTITVSAGPEVYLNEGEATTWTTGSGKNVYVKYTAVNGWNTICLPISVNAYKTHLFGSGATLKFYALKAYDNETCTLTFETSNYAGAGTPYLVYVENAASSNFIAENVNVGYAPNGASTVAKSTAKFKGTFAPVAAGDFTGDMYGVTSDGHIRPGDGVNAKLKGYRAYFTGVSAPVNGVKMMILEGDDETDLGFVKMVDENAKDVYTLTGQKVQKGRKGIYIVNGKKVVIK